MHFHVMTLFPQMVLDGIATSVTGRGMANGAFDVEAVDIRDYTRDKHGKTDDYPYGGGAGMLMQAQPIYDCYRAILDGIAGRREAAGVDEALEQNGIPGVRTLYMSPAGRVFDQKFAAELATEEDLIILCGHYEGVDERALELISAEDVSIGDYVLTGGELPAMVMIDCISRLIPGVLGKQESAEVESFHDSLLEYPQYSRPEEYMGLKVPEVLLSGHHGNVDKWRREQSIMRTLERRPDLLVNAVLSKKERKFLEECITKSGANANPDENIRENDKAGQRDMKATVIDSRDNVAVVLGNVKKGDRVSFKRSGKEESVEALEDISEFHKIAIEDIVKGAPVIKYGEHIGLAAAGIKKGEHVHVHNVLNHREQL